MQLPDKHGSADPHPMRRRSFPRHPTLLPAQLITADRAVRPCVIQDYCSGGALVVFEPGGGDSQISPDDEVELRCLAAGGSSNLVFRGRVAHCNGSRVGLALLDPDPRAMTRLRDAAQQANAAARPGTNDPTVSARDRATVLAACNEHVRTALGGLIARFHSAIGNELFETAKHSRDPRVQSANFGALAELNNRKKDLEEGFLRETEARLQRLTCGRLPDDVATRTEDLSVDSLSLVEDREFDTWLSITDFMDAVRNRFREPLHLLDQRLSVVFGEPVGADNDPYGPMLLAQGFQAALDLLDLQHAAYLSCYKVFKQSFLTQAGRFYEQLNRILIEHGILPQLKYGYNAAAQPKRAPPSASPGDVVGSATGAGEHDGTWEATGGPPAVPAGGWATHEEISRPSPAVAGASAPLAAARGAGSASSAPSIAPPPDTGDAARPASDLFQLFGALNDLQHGLHPGRSTEVNVGDVAAGTAQPLVYSATELQRALARPVLLSAAQSADAPDTSLRARIETALGQLSDGDARSIGGHESRVIDVTGEVFQSLLTDAQVPREVQPWLKGLEIPVLRVALADNSVFLDKSHVVRHVINKLARLEVLADSEQGAGETAIRAASAEVVDRINRDFDGTAAAFASALDSLDELIRLQSEIQRQNLKQVVAECLRTEGETRAASPKAEAAAADDTWLRRVGRLKEGHWVLFDALSDEPRRLKVAWIATRTNKYVFVNPVGKKERVLLADELAALLREGRAVVLDATEEPAMDRAQFAMLQKLHKQLLYESTHDRLTGLINRREFEKCLADALENAREQKAKHVICILDIDQFKLINNTCGYEAGDHLLREFVELLQPAVGGAGILGRIGPDEFGLLLHRQSLDDAVELVEEQLERLEDYRFAWKEERRSVSVSVGMAAVSARSEDISALLQAAESSCAVAKEMGGGRIQMYHSGHAGLSRRKAEMEWAGKIDKALDGNELHLRCQRIEPIREDTGDRCHYELLLGLSDDLGAQVGLQDFVKAAEHHKRIVDLDRWVIRNAFQWIADNEDSLLGIGSFSINLSGSSLNDEDLFHFIRRQVRETGMPTHKVCFEITETAGISNLSDAAEFINIIKDFGFRFSLDDFGSGMSSYAYLKNLPVDYLKIDGAFIRDLVSSPSDYAVTKSVCEIGHFMGKKVIAEYVENQDTVSVLREIGVDFAQGYGIERPMRLEELLQG